MIKKLSILFVLLSACLLMSAAEANAYYRVMAGTLNGRQGPDKSSAKVTKYSRDEILYITELSSNGKWGYVSKDHTWVSMTYVQQISKAEQEDVAPSPQGSYPLRIIMWVMLGLLVVGTIILAFAEKPFHSIGVLYATVLLCALVIVVMACAQFVLCWGLKIVGWIDYYIFFGWFLDACTGIFAVIAFIVDIPTYGLYGLLAGVLPILLFGCIVHLFEDYSFAKWVVYVFQIPMLVLLLSIDNESLYIMFNQYLQLDGVPAIATLADSSDWGEHANTVFVWAFYLGTATLIIPESWAEKIEEKVF